MVNQNGSELSDAITMAKFWKDFTFGVSTYFKSFGFIVRNKMMHYYLYPIIFIIMFSVFATFGIRTLDELITPLVNDLFGVEELPGGSWWEKTKAFFSQIGAYVVSFVLWVSLLYIYYKINKYLVLIVMSPVMALIAERTDEVMTGQSFPFSWTQLVKDVWRGILIAIRNGFLEIGLTILISLLNLALTFVFPPLTIITTPLSTILIFFIGAYFYGFATMDYTNERYRLNVRESVGVIRQNKGLAVANGAIFSLWLIIPVIGTFLGTVFAPVTCTVGATIALMEKKERGELDSYRAPEARD